MVGELTDKEIKLAREQLQAQIDKMPDGQQKAMAQEQLNSMTDEVVESMVLEQRGGGGKQESQKGIFRMIVDGDVPSKKVDENKDAVAVVSVRAVSKGHVLIIPKKPVGDANLISANAFGLARSVAKKIVSKLKSKSTEIQTESLFGEVVIDVIPVYDKQVNLSSPRYEVKEDELEEVYKKLRIVKKPKIERVKQVKKPTEVLKLKRRVP